MGLFLCAFFCSSASAFTERTYIWRWRNRGLFSTFKEEEEVKMENSGGVSEAGGLLFMACLASV